MKKENRVREGEERKTKQIKNRLLSQYETCQGRGGECLLHRRCFTLRDPLLTTQLENPYIKS